MKKFLIWLCSIVGGVALMIVGLYNCAEGQYQKEADIVRMHHFNYYAQLLEEYKQKKFFE